MPRTHAESGGGPELDGWDSIFVSGDEVRRELHRLKGNREVRLASSLRAARQAARMNLPGKKPTPSTGPTPAMRLRERLLTIAPLLGLDVASSTTELLNALGAVAVETPAQCWFVLASAAGSLPDSSQVVGLTRALRATTADARGAVVLQHAAPIAAARRSELRPLIVETGRLVFIMPSDLSGDASDREHREITSRLAAQWHRHPIRPVESSHDGVDLRVPTASSPEGVDSPDAPLVLPWRVPVLIASIIDPRSLPTFEALASSSGNDVIVLGVDTLPVTAPSLLADPSRTVRFGRHLTAVRHASLVITTSRAAAAEFDGYASGLAAQGLRGPQTASVPVPVLMQDPGADLTAGPDARPIIALTSGSTPRVNTIRALLASERLWRDGFEFELRVLHVSQDAPDTEVREAVSALRSAGRPIDLANEQDSEFARAAFTVHVPLHGGSGRRMATVLGAGRPVITTGYGVTSELAATGGCLLVDPRDASDIAAAMKSLLTEPELAEGLTTAAAARTGSDWASYADKVWALVDAHRTRDTRDAD